MPSFLTIPKDSPKILQKLSSVLRYVSKSRRSNFYQKHFNVNNFQIQDIKTYQDWELIPFLKKENITKTPMWQRTYLPREKVFAVRFTSGTTNRTALLTPRKVFGNFAIRPFQAGIKRQISFMQSWYLSELERRASGCVSINMFYPKTPNDFDLMTKIATQFHPDSIATYPIYLLEIAPYFKKQGILKNIKIVEIYGERCSESLRKKILKVYDNPILVSNYSLSEATGVLGVACAYTMKHRLTSFHFDNNALFLEFIDPQTGKAKYPNTPSELVISSLSTDQPFPLIRYRTQDLIKIEEEKCPCGRIDPRFVIVGRLSERVRMGGSFEISLSAIEEAAHACNNLINEDDFEAHYYFKRGENRRDTLTRPQLHMCIKPEKNNANKKIIALLLAKNLMVGIKDSYADSVREGYFLPLTVSILSNKKKNSKKEKRIKFFTHF
ncbi:MAG: phenylacetate--CoA ligase family protein [Parcubacteria group bacterium]|nr:phenylacetate--CoA ligase family protein [Parcubacteria group bacterium]